MRLGLWVPKSLGMVFARVSRENPCLVTSLACEAITDRFDLCSEVLELNFHLVNLIVGIGLVVRDLFEHLNILASSVLGMFFKDNGTAM